MSPPSLLGRLSHPHLFSPPSNVPHHHQVEKVARLTQLSQLYRDNAHSVEAAAMLDMLTSMGDVAALLVKLADRLHDMRTLASLPRCKQVRVANETLEVFAVLANRLGAWSLKAELEDLAFATLHPEEHAAVAAAVAARAAAAALPARVAEARAALEAAGLEAVDVSARVKNAYGVWRKLRAAGLGAGRVDAVPDVAALRVVVPRKHDCYAALRAVEALWAPAPGRFKDYIRNRKANGYQSLHAGVLLPGAAAAGADTAAGTAAPRASLEVQIRTPKMHYLAEYGLAAHYRYKEGQARRQTAASSAASSPPNGSPAGSLDGDEGLGDDAVLDRLVRWKRWVAAEKLGLRDGAKVRAAAASDGAAGSPPAAAGADPALGSLASAAAAAIAAATGEGDEDAAGAAGSPSAAAALDARFMARFRLTPVSDADASEARGAAVMVAGPRGGARLLECPPGATLGDLLASGALPEARAAAGAGGSLTLNGRALPLVAQRGTKLRAGDVIGYAPAPAAVELLPTGGRAAPVEAALRERLAASTSQLRQAAMAL